MSEGIDFNKLKTIVRSNLIWIVLIFIIVNLVAFAINRYSKDVFVSNSELKLETKNTGTELGLPGIVEDQTMNILSGEIEIIQSKLFLNRVIDSMNIDVVYISRGEFLDTELYHNSPISVQYTFTGTALYNMPIYLFPLDGQHFRIRIGENGNVYNGTFDQPVQINGDQLLISRTNLPFEENNNGAIR